MSPNDALRIGLSRHADLKRRGEDEILVLPEQAIRLGGSGAEILGLCDGTRSQREIVDAMRERYPETHEIEGEVVAFLEQMQALGGLESRE